MDINLDDDKTDEAGRPGKGARVRYKPANSALSQPEDVDSKGYIYGTVVRHSGRHSGHYWVDVDVGGEYYEDDSTVVGEPTVEAKYLEVVD